MASRRVVFYLALVTLGWILFDFSLAFPEDFRYDNHGKRDPFVSPGDAGLGNQAGGPGDLHLEGIVVDRKGGSFAILNGQVVREGESFEGFLLKKVEMNRALFEKDGESFEVVLRQDDELIKQYLEHEESTKKAVLEGPSGQVTPSGQNQPQSEESVSKLEKLGELTKQKLSDKESEKSVSKK